MADDELRQFTGDADAEAAFDAAQEEAGAQQRELAEDTLDDEADAVAAQDMKTLAAGATDDDAAGSKAAAGSAAAGSAAVDASASAMAGDEAAAAALRKVQGVLNATVDERSMTPQMKRMMQRQEDNTRRVAEAIKGTKANPSWFVPTFCALMILGLIWAVVYYFNPSYPIPGINAWNLLIGFSLIFVGFIMMMWWR